MIGRRGNAETKGRGRKGGMRDEEEKKEKKRWSKGNKRKVQ